jgi:hypothetical protein
MAIGQYALTSVNLVQQSLTFGDDDLGIIERLIDAVTLKIENRLNRQVMSRARAEFYDGTGTDRLYLRNYPITSIQRVSVGRDAAMTVQHTGSQTATVEVQATGTTTDATTPAIIEGQTGNVILTDVSAGSTTRASIALDDYATIGLLATQIATNSGWTATVVSGFTNHNSRMLAPTPGAFCEDFGVQLEIPFEGLVDEYQLIPPATLKRRSGWPRGWRNVYVEHTAGETTVPKDLEQVATKAVISAYQAKRETGQYKEFRLADFAYKLADTAEIDALLTEKLDNYIRPAI